MQPDMLNEEKSYLIHSTFPASKETNGTLGQITDLVLGTFSALLSDKLVQPLP